MPDVLKVSPGELARRESIVRDILQKRADFVEKARERFYGVQYARCNTCGHYCEGISSVLDLSFKCLNCCAMEKFPIPDFDAEERRPYIAPELNDRAPRLDVEDFARI